MSHNICMMFSLILLTIQKYQFRIHFVYDIRVIIVVIISYSTF